MSGKCSSGSILYACLVLALVTTAPSGWAQESVPTLEEVVVTATRTEVPIAELGVSATVITAEEIERRQTTDVLELLRDVAGLNLVQSGSRGGTTTLFPRGGEENYTLVLIDGVQVNEAGGGFDLSNLTTDNIERIEIIRGPQSALYGSDAIGGVVHVITKKGVGKPTVSISTGHGAHSENGKYIGEQKIRASGGNESIGASFAYGRVDDRGILDVNNDFFNNTFSGRVDIYPDERADITFAGRLNDSEFNFPTENGGDRPDVIFPGLDPDQRTKTNDASGSGRIRFDLLPWWEHDLQFGVHHLERDTDDPANPERTALDAPPGNFTDSLETRITFDYHMNLRFPAEGWLQSTLTLGYEYDREDLDLETLSTIVFGDSAAGFFFTSTSNVQADRDNHAYYLQEQISLFDRLHLVGGFRVEDNSEFGTDVNPRGSVAVDIEETGTKLRGAIGTGIKEPTFLENFGGFGTVGNPDLDPEQSFSWEVGLDQSFWGDRVQLGLTYFENTFDDMIAFVFVPATATSTFENIQEAESKGVEFTARVKPGFGLTVGGSYTYLDTEVTDDGGIGNLFFADGEELLRRPRHSAALFLDWLWKGLNVHVTGTYVGERDDTLFTLTRDPTTGLFTFNVDRQENDDYFLLDVAASYTIDEFSRSPLRSFKIFAKGRNVLDENYEEALGFSSARISGMAGVAFTF